jgi:geranylgeranyl diphosphate synthase type I
VHDFSLLHDDVMDGDQERRHRPTAWALFGVGRAIVAGDAMLTLSQELLLEDDGNRKRAAAAELSRATAEMIRGQCDDLSFETRIDMTIDEGVRMSMRKTGDLLGCAAALGGILAGWTLRLAERHLERALSQLEGCWLDDGAASDQRQVATFVTSRDF